MAAWKLSQMRLRNCYCMNLRDASLIIAVLFTVFSVVFFIGSMIGAISSGRYVQVQKYGNGDTTESEYQLEFFLVGFAVFATLLVATCVMLIRGILIKSSFHMFPWICLNFTALLVLLALAIALIIYQMLCATPTGFFMALLGVPIVLSITGYLFMVLFSFYRDLLEGSDKNMVLV